MYYFFRNKYYNFGVYIIEILRRVIRFRGILGYGGGKGYNYIGLFLFGRLGGEFELKE